MASTFPGAAATELDQLGILANLADTEGINPLEFLAELDAPDHSEGTRPGLRVPGEGESPGLGLTDEEMTELGHELSDLVDRYFRATEAMVEQEEEIREAYAMAGAGDHSGVSGSASKLVSEQVMVKVDQVFARLNTNLMSVTPIAKVDPVLGSPFGRADVTDLAKAAQDFLQDYTLYTMDMRHILPRALHRATKVGTAVLRLGWEETTRRVGYYPEAGGEAIWKTEKVAGVKPRLIDNRLVVVWPPTVANWQDAEVCGHMSWHSRSAWRRLARSWKLTAEEVAAVEADPGEKDQGAEREAARSGIDTGQLDQQKLLHPQVCLLDLWCHMALPGHDTPQKFYAILHRPSRRIYWADWNPHFSQRHPYFPIRYKWGDSSAWGTGVGHEALYFWAADTALWNLSLDNIAAGAFTVVLRDAASVHSTLNRPWRPGMEVVVEDTERDFVPRKVGGDAQELPEARLEVNNRCASATGLPPVSAGFGDPTMKSGAGTGSTLALIQQASMKMRLVDSNVREDWTDPIGFTLELVAQYGSDGVFYRHADPDNADLLRQLRYYPPKGDVTQLFRIRAAAPTASSSDEARRNSYLVIWGFAQQSVQVMDSMVLPLLQEQNPAAIPRWIEAKLRYLSAIEKRVVELHEIPGIVDLIPEIPAPTPQDQIINDLTMQLGQAQQVLAELQGVVQQLMPMPANGNGAGIMPGMGANGGGASGLVAPPS